MAQSFLPKVIAASGISTVALLLLALHFANAAPKPRPFRTFIVGDSITIGERDQGLRKVPASSAEGMPSYGFIPRVKHTLPEIEIAGVGFEGKSALRIGEKLDELLASVPILKTKLSEADLVIFAGGLNDFWERIAPRSAVLRTRTISVKLHSLAPHAKVVAASLIMPMAEDHNKWVFQYNKILFSHSFRNLTVGPRFESLPATALSVDGVHPSTEGYDTLGSILSRFICQQIGSGRNDPQQPVIVPQSCRADR